MKYFSLKLIIFLVIGLGGQTEAWSAKGQEKVVGTYYFVPFYGHLHQNPSPYSQSLTTLACGHPVKLIVNEGMGRGVWDLVETAGKKGYVQAKYLSASRPLCFERKYPEFVQKMELRIEDLYYWGKLYDNYTYAEIKLP